MLALPRIITPALRNLCTTGASKDDRIPRRTMEPQVVSVLSLVMMLSFKMIGIPCRMLQNSSIWLDRGLRRGVKRTLPSWAAQASFLVKSMCDRLRLGIPLSHSMEYVIYLAGPGFVGADKLDRRETTSFQSMGKLLQRTVEEGRDSFGTCFPSVSFKFPVKPTSTQERRADDLRLSIHRPRRTWTAANRDPNMTGRDRLDVSRKEMKRCQ